MLKVSYQVIRASVPLLELARDQAFRRGAEDAVAAGIAAYLARHVEEERGHDEWLRKDLESLGVSTQDLDEALPSPHVASLVGAQHYWAIHVHPVAILGYLAVLEGEPPDETFFAQAAQRSGLPEAAFSTLRYHARVDREHWRDLLDIADALPLSGRDLSLIGLSILHTCGGMEAAIRSVVEQPVLSRSVV
ncbi:MAG TPA: iron-containing redox enzyme family protein [Holophagaceae bacterium]|nr:iron-containing redox enzyme family protein [Holophagaceae bacterium]